MQRKTYPGFAFRQGMSASAPLIVSFVAPAEEVIDWAGMPRRSADDAMAGFQRRLPDRAICVDFRRIVPRLQRASG